jgi:hypothetical protein
MEKSQKDPYVQALRPRLLTSSTAMSCCTFNPRSWRGLSGFNSRSPQAARLARDHVRNTKKKHQKYCASPRQQFKRDDLAIRETEYVAHA